LSHAAIISMNEPTGSAIDVIVDGELEGRGTAGAVTLLAMRLEDRHESSRVASRSAEQSLTQELPGELVDVVLVSRSPTADGDDEHRDLSSLDAIDDAIALADRANAAEPGQLSHERLALLLGR